MSVPVPRGPEVTSPGDPEELAPTSSVVPDPFTDMPPLNVLAPEVNMTLDPGEPEMVIRLDSELKMAPSTSINELVRLHVCADVSDNEPSMYRLLCDAEYPLMAMPSVPSKSVNGPVIKMDSPDPPAPATASPATA